MAQLKDLIVNGPSRFIGDVYATTFTGDLNGNANTATSATTAAALTGKTLVTASSITTSNWPTYADNYIPTMSFMAHWNGAYSGTSSNLAYCAQGAIIGSNNIGNQSVNYATTSGTCSGNAATATNAANADTLDGIDSAGFLRQVVVANNTTNDFNTFENMTLTGRTDPTTEASLVNAPWTGVGPAGGFGVLTYLFDGRSVSYGTQIACGYSSNKIYIRNRYWGGSGVGSTWATTWDSLALTSEVNTLLSKCLPLTGGTMTGVITSSYESGSWINGVNNAIIKATYTGYGAVLSMPVKDGRVSLSSYPLSDNNIYFGYATATQISAGINYHNTQMYWDAANNNLHADVFTGALSGNASTATKWATSRVITVTGSVTGSISLDGSTDVTLETTTNHTHTGSEVTLTGYSHRNSYETINETDTVNQAIAKLEGAISGLEDLLASI